MQMAKVNVAILQRGRSRKPGAWEETRAEHMPMWLPKEEVKKREPPPQEARG